MPRVTETPKMRAAARIEGIIKEGITKKRMTYEELAMRVGMSARTLRNYRKNPMNLRRATVAKLSDVLGIPEEVFDDALRNASSR